MKTLKPVHSFLKAWQPRLLLADWHIRVVDSRAEASSSTIAHITFELSEKEAILYCYPMLFGENRIDRTRTLLHELVHLVVTELEVKLLADAMEERLCDRFAKILQELGG